MSDISDLRKREQTFLYECPELGIERDKTGALHGLLYRYFMASTFAADVRNHDSMLDYGCGSGAGAELLAVNFDEAWGVDKDQTANAYAKKMHSRSGVKYVTSIEDVHPSKPMGFVSIIECVEHMKPEEAKALLLKIRPMMASEGILFMTTPLALNKSGFSDNPWHVHEYQPIELKDLVLSAGFREPSVFSPGEVAQIMLAAKV